MYIDSGMYVYAFTNKFLNKLYVSAAATSPRTSQIHFREIHSAQEHNAIISPFNNIYEIDIYCSEAPLFSDGIFIIDSLLL